MLVAYISDLHLEHRDTDTGVPVGADEIRVYGDVRFPKEIDADVLIIAGDIHSHREIRTRVLNTLRAAYSIPVIDVDGNHEFYHESFPTGGDGAIHDVKGVKIATATLWTHLDPMLALRAREFADFRFIKNISVAQWNYLHNEHVRFLEKSDADIIVTHHCPTYESVHPDYRGDPVNGFFANNYDLRRFAPCKLWVHGHTHKVIDYATDQTRVVCNPWGYPWEKQPFEIKYVKI